MAPTPPETQKVGIIGNVPQRCMNTSQMKNLGMYIIPHRAEPWPPPQCGHNKGRLLG